LYLLNKEYMYEYKNGRVVKKELKPEKGIYTSLIYFKDIFNNTFKLSSDINEEDLIIEAETQLFNSGTIDLAKDYQITYKFQKFDDYYLVDAFIIEVDKLEQKFSDILKTFKYIDFISAAPFVFEEYYDIVNITPKIDVFIYFTKEDAFIVGFKEKKFVFVKSLDKFSKLVSALNMKEDEVIKLLQENGLDKEKYEDENIAMQVDTFFSQFFMKVNNLINYSKNFYHLEQVDRIFFYSDIKINHLIENYVDFWNLSGIEFKKFEIESSEYDPFYYTACIYNAKNYENEELNFSPFIRPPVFYKTETGKFIIFSSIVLFIVLMDAFYQYWIIHNQEKKLSELQRAFHKKERQLKLVKTYVKKYKNKIKKEKETILKTTNRIDDISSKINYLYTIKTKDKLYNQIADIINFITKHNLKLLKFEKTNNNFTILVSSSINNSNLLANFIQYLIKLGYKNVLTKEISNTKNSYITQIRYSNE